MNSLGTYRHRCIAVIVESWASCNIMFHICWKSRKDIKLVASVIIKMFHIYEILFQKRFCIGLNCGSKLGNGSKVRHSTANFGVCSEEWHVFTHSVTASVHSVNYNFEIDITSYLSCCSWTCGWFDWLYTVSVGFVNQGFANSFLNYYLITYCSPHTHLEPLWKSSTWVPKNFQQNIKNNTYKDRIWCQFGQKYVRDV